MNRHSAPEAKSGETEAGKVVLRDAVIASGDASELLELADGSLNAISELVFGGIEGPFAGHACALGNDRLGAAGLDMVEDGVGIVGFVSDDIIGLETGQQRDRDCQEFRVWAAG